MFLTFQQAGQRCLTSTVISNSDDVPEVINVTELSRLCGPPSLRISFPGIKRSGRGVDDPPHLARELKERVRKGKVRPRIGHEGPEGEKRYSSTLSLASAPDGDRWLTSRLGRFTPWKET
jgi:hypothetical protein